ncbi:MAG TPA: hypothetical protein VL221_05180 [Bacteroidota bacterium]|nr:hypothetical protein [Bacteroidota bacterium]
MRRLVAAIAFTLILGGCGPNYDGRYPIDTMRMMAEGPRVTTLVRETFPLDAWFEIQSGTLLRVHSGGVTSTYRNARFVKTLNGFDAVTDDPRGAGLYSWSFERGAKGDLCSLTFTHDGIHYMRMVSKGRTDG